MTASLVMVSASSGAAKAAEGGAVVTNRLFRALAFHRR
jgi:hypothetical protein